MNYENQWLWIDIEIQFLKTETNNPVDTHCNNNNRNNNDIYSTQNEEVTNEDEWGALECGLYKACQAPITDGGLFTDTGVNG